MIRGSQLREELKVWEIIVDIKGIWEYFLGDIKGKDEDLEKKCTTAMKVIIPGICGKCFLRLSATTLS